jgi:hypothetical protein
MSSASLFFSVGTLFFGLASIRLIGQLLGFVRD